MTWLGVEAGRLAAAAATVTLYAALCLRVATTQRRRAAAAHTRALAGAGDARPLLIVHASQTGAAERLAGQAAQALRGAARPLRVAALGTLAPADLAAASAVLLIASTCGEGDAPDSAAPFLHRCRGKADADALDGVDYGVLALGDRRFAHFCAFGRQLDGWMRDRGAHALFDRIEVDALAEHDLARWKSELGRLAGVGAALAWPEPGPERGRDTWRLARRTLANPGSCGAPVYHLELEPPPGSAPAWEPGDLVRIRVPHAPDQPRDYSIASVPAEGRAHLLVRQARHPDGRLGLVSGWLTRDAEIGDAVVLDTLAHRPFRLGDNAERPLILVGNGTGIAGLRAHLSARASRPRPHGTARSWLVFGERQRAHDFHFRADVEAWQADGTLARVDLAFSRDQSHTHYVQDCLRARRDAVRQWLDEGAAVYVCGSLKGMATGVEAALRDILGKPRLDALTDAGRYRRDVY